MKKAKRSAGVVHVDDVAGSADVTDSKSAAVRQEGC